MRRVTVSPNGDVEFEAVDWAEHPTLAKVARIDLFRNASSVWRLVRFDPETDVPLHTTPTIDYIFVLDGVVELTLDRGETVTLRRGDCLLQHRALHGWRTDKNQSAVVCAVLVDD